MPDLNASPSNSEQPNIPFHPEIGPIEGSFGATSLEITSIVLRQYRIDYERFCQGSSLLPNMNRKLPKLNANTIRRFRETGYVLGVEGWNSSCFWVCVIWVLSQGNMWRRINTNTLSGYILYMIACEFLLRGFLGRDIIEAFRLSLREHPTIRGNDFEQGLNDPNEVLGMLEDLNILQKGPMFSHTGCSFVVHEARIGGQLFHSFQNAVNTSMIGSTRPNDNSILCFQLCQQNGKFRQQLDSRGLPLFDHNGQPVFVQSKNLKGNPIFEPLQTVGTQIQFPFDGIVVRGKLFRVKMFYIFGRTHYQVVFCMGDNFFLANSLSASNNGHCLPVMTEISEDEAMRLFRECAHTVVFSCDGDAFPKEGNITCDGPAFRKECSVSPKIVMYGGEKYFLNEASRLTSVRTNLCYQIYEPTTVYSFELNCEILIFPKQSSDEKQVVVPDPPPTVKAPVVQQDRIKIFYRGNPCWYDPSNHELRNSGPIGGLIDDVSGPIDVLDVNHRRITIFVKGSQQRPTQQRPTQQRLEQLFEEIRLTDINRENGTWSVLHNGFKISGQCLMTDFFINFARYKQTEFLAELNRLYREFISKQ